MSSLNIQVTLVRHGQTSANKAQIIQGNADVPLSDVGRSQAKQLGNYLNQHGITFDYVYSSDLSRALETAQLAIGDKLPIKLDKRLRERAFGVVEGKSVDSYRQAARQAGFKEKELSYFTPEGGETLPQVNQRVKDWFWSELIKSLDGKSTSDGETKVLVVTHGGVIREFMRFFRDECRCDFKGREIMVVTPNTGVNSFKLSVNKATKKVKSEVIKIHDITHLEEIKVDNQGSDQPAAAKKDNNCPDSEKQGPSLVAL